jgi:hypothetical protein
MTSKGKAYATRTSGNVYGVTYERSRADDRDVSGEYLNELVRSGYEVIVTQPGYGGPERGALVGGEVKWIPHTD